MRVGNVKSEKRELESWPTEFNWQSRSLIPGANFRSDSF